MAKYKNGIESKKKILMTAKKLFYTHGYQKTTMALLAQEANVPVGLINYYYKKNELLGAIYHNFLFVLLDSIETQCQDRIENQLQKHIVMVRLFYHIIFNDDANKNIYKIILKHELIPQEAHKLVRNSLFTIISELNISVKKDIFQKMMVAEYGARKALLEENYDHLDPETSAEFINFLATITVRLVGVNLDIIEYNVKKADALLKIIDFSEIRFLI